MPSVRSRLVSAKLRSKWRMSSEPIAVSWWTITSGVAPRDGVARPGQGRARRRPPESRRGLEQTAVGLAARHAHDLVAGGHQPRHELLADRSRRTGNKHFHRRLLSAKTQMQPVRRDSRRARDRQWRSDRSAVAGAGPAVSPGAVRGDVVRAGRGGALATYAAISPALMILALTPMIASLWLAPGIPDSLSSLTVTVPSGLRVTAKAGALVVAPSTRASTVANAAAPTVVLARTRGRLVTSARARCDAGRRPRASSRPIARSSSTRNRVRLGGRFSFTIPPLEGPGPVAAARATRAGERRWGGSPPGAGRRRFACRRRGQNSPFTNTSRDGPNLYPAHPAPVE